MAKAPTTKAAAEKPAAAKSKPAAKTVTAAKTKVPSPPEPTENKPATSEKRLPTPPAPPTPPEPDALPDGPMPVRAYCKGFYGGVLREIGDTFRLSNGATEFSSKWMVPLEEE